VALGRKTGGRSAGVPNKFNGDIKALIIGALHEAGGVRYLARQAVENPGPFLALVGKVLPLQVTGKDGVPLQVDFRWADAPAGAVSSATNMVASVTIEADAEPDLIEWAKPELAND
jgi:hypothetical protein